ncbi:MAG: cache domain-containing protein [Alphaproteobacteria bacterium]|nr:cache domain-containing protein [Alphaproteobacteria bacterium]
MLDIFPVKHIHPKLLRIIAVLFIAFAALTGYMLDNYHATLLKERQDKTHKLVENAYNLISYYHAKGEAAELTKDQARHYALDSIKQLSSDQDGYFWVMDTHPSMIMHPIQPELDGLDLKNYVGPDGKKLFLDMVIIAETQKAGFIEYAWTKPHAPVDQLYPKVSYIKLFEPWDWIVGSGVYIDDVDSAFMNAVYVACGLSVFILLFILTLALTLTDVRRQR